jgi:putative ABC transport system permease protein
MKLAFLRHSEMKEETAEELRSHVQHRADDLERSGLSRAEAERRARIEFGGMERFREECREASGGYWLETLLQDARFGLRMLRKSPGFTAVAVLTLALGIGANTAIFSVVNTVLLQPLPFPQAKQLVAITEANSQFGDNAGSSYPNFAAWREQSKSLREIAGYQFHQLTLTGVGEPAVLDTVVTTPSLFSVLEIKPLAGRIFSEDDGKQGAAPVVILNENFWRKRFAQDPHIIGKAITLDMRPYTVVGIMPESFHYPVSMPNQDIWIPLRQDPLFGKWTERQGGHWLRVIARLRPEFSLEEAQTELNTIFTRHLKDFPDDNPNWTVHLVPLHQMVTGNVKSPLIVLLCAVGLVLLIACANIANLLLARATSRSREMAVRMALGADRQRITRQLLTESTILGLLGGVTGILLAYCGVRALVSLLPAGLSQIHSIRVDGLVLAFALVLSLAASLIFGLAPVFLAARSDPQANLREGGRAGEARGPLRARNMLAIGEVALAMILLVAAGLLMRSFIMLTSVQPGFEAKHVVKADISLPQFQYSTPQQWAAFADELLSRLQSRPGMQNSAMVAPLPIVNGFINLGFSIVGHAPLPPGTSLTANYVAASPKYFSVMGIPLLRGRLFSENDSASTPRVAVISATLAKRYFPNENPLGRQIVIGFPPNGDAPREIVGVAGDVRDVSLSDDPGPMVYVPFAQAPFWGGEVVVKNSLSVSDIANTIRQETAGIDKGLPVTEIESLPEAVSASVAAPRFRTWVLGLFGAMALVLAAVGIFGVVSYSVSRRTQEIGIRMALGATPGNVRRLVMGESAKLVLLGLAIGIPASLVLTRFLSTLLFGVHATDPLTFSGVALLLVLVAMVAAYIPARRAMRVEPTVALRYE